MKVTKVKVATVISKMVDSEYNLITKFIRDTENGFDIKYSTDDDNSCICPKCGYWNYDKETETCSNEDCAEEYISENDLVDYIDEAISQNDKVFINSKSVN